LFHLEKIRQVSRIEIYDFFFFFFKRKILNINSCFQLVRDVAIALLGKFRHDRSNVVRFNGHKELHAILGAPHVRFLLRNQCHCAVEHANRYDVEFLSNYFGGCQFSGCLQKCLNSLHNKLQIAV